MEMIGGWLGLERRINLNLCSSWNCCKFNSFTHFSSDCITRCNWDLCLGTQTLSQGKSKMMEVGIKLAVFKMRKFILHLVHGIQSLFGFGPQTLSCRFDSGRGESTQGHLWLCSWVPRSRPRLGNSLWPLLSKTCKRTILSVQLPACLPKFINKFELQSQGPISPHCIVTLPNSNGLQLLLCYDNEGVYVSTNGKVRNQLRKDSYQYCGNWYGKGEFRIWFLISDFKVYSPTVGRTPVISCIHWDRASDGLGPKGDWDSLSWDGSPGRGFHAQEEPTPQIPMRTERQSFLFLSKRWWSFTNLFHDVEQAWPGQLVTSLLQVRNWQTTHSETFSCRTGVFCY